MSDIKHAKQTTGLSEFIDAWKAFQTTKSKLDGLQLLFVIDNLVNRVTAGYQASQSPLPSGRRMIEADILLPIYEVLFKKVKLSADLFGKENVNRTLKLAMYAEDKKLTKIASSASQICQTLTYLSQQAEEKTETEEETEQGGLTDEQLTTLFTDVFEKPTTQFSIDEHVETNVLPTLEDLYKRISLAKQSLAKLTQNKPNVLQAQLESFDTLIKEERAQHLQHYSFIDSQVQNCLADNRELIKGVLGTLHATELFTVSELKDLVEPPASQDEQGDQSPRQRIFKNLQEKAVSTGKLTNEEAQSLEGQLVFFEKINKQLHLLNPCTLPEIMQEKQIVLQLYKEAVLEDFQNLHKGLLKDFETLSTAIKSGRIQLLNRLLKHLKKICDTEIDITQLQVLLTNIQYTDSFDQLLKDSKFLADALQQTSKEDIAYAELLFNLQKGSFDLCQKITAAVKAEDNLDENRWEQLKKTATEVNNIIDSNQKILSQQLDFFPTLKQIYLKILSFLGLSEKRDKYIATQYKKTVPVTLQTVEEVIAYAIQKPDTGANTRKTDEKPSSTNEISTDTQSADNKSLASDTVVATTIAPYALTDDSTEITRTTDRRHAILRRTGTLFDDIRKAELAEMYWIEEVRAQTEAQAGPTATQVQQEQEAETQQDHDDNDTATPHERASAPALRLIADMAGGNGQEKKKSPKFNPGFGLLANVQLAPDAGSQQALRLKSVTCKP
jgi:hypothetical protein